MPQQHLTEEQCRAKTYFCGVCSEWKFDQPSEERVNDIRYLSGWIGTLFKCTTCGAVVGRDVEVMS